MEPTTAEPLAIDSEEEVDATLDNPSESSAFDCSGLIHFFDVDENLDRYYDPEDDSYFACDSFPCPNRYQNLQEPPPGNLWAVTPEPWQVTPLPPSSTEEEDLESVYELSPLLAPTPLPPDAPLQFAPPQSPLPTLDLTENLVDSPQFFLLTMGDIKPDSVPLLSSASQYADWAAKMKGLLMFMNCWDVVSSTSTEPTDAEERKEYKKKNAQACGLLYMRTGPSFHYLLETKTTNGTTSAADLTDKEMWDALKDKFGKPNSAHVWGLFESLISESRMSDQRSLQDQMSRIVTRIREISTNGLKLEDNIQALILLSKVPESYRPMISALMATMDLDKITVDIILEKSLSEEAMRKTGQSAARISKTKPKPSGPCDFCGSQTHHESTCYKKHPDRSSISKADLPCDNFIPVFSMFMFDQLGSSY